MKLLKANCYYLYTPDRKSRQEFIIYVISVKRQRVISDYPGQIGAVYTIKRRIWSARDSSLEGGHIDDMRYAVGNFPMTGLTRLSEKEALLTITAWML